MQDHVPVKCPGLPSDLRVLERLLSSTTGGDAERFEVRCAAVASWPALLNLAERHGVLAIIERAVRRSQFVPPPEVGVDLRRRATVQRLAQSQLVAASDEVLAALDSAGVPAVALKGPVLGERLHGNPTLRVATDLDVMVALDQVPTSIAVLERLGYRASRDALSRIRTDFDHHLKLHREDGTRVELHYRLSTSFGVAIPSEEPLARSLPFRTAGGAACRVLSREDELIFLATHAAQHLFVRLAWLYDVKILLDLPPAPDWRVALDRALEQRVGRAYSFAISQIAARMEISLPAGALPPPLAQELPAAARFLQAAGFSSPIYSTFYGKCFRAALCDSPTIVAAHVTRRTVELLRRRLGLG